MYRQNFDRALRIFSFTISISNSFVTPTRLRPLAAPPPPVVNSCIFQGLGVTAVGPDPDGARCGGGKKKKGDGAGTDQPAAAGGGPGVSHYEAGAGESAAGWGPGKTSASQSKETASSPSRSTLPPTDWFSFCPTLSSSGSSWDHFRLVCLEFMTDKLRTEMNDYI